MIGTFHLSRRQAQGFLSAVMNTDISLGSVHNQTLEVAKATQQPVEAVAEAIKQAPIVHCDESGWKRQRGYRVLWVAVTTTLALFRIQTERSKAACQVMLGRVDGKRVVNSDRYSAYQWIADENRQVCWAHLDRDFLLMSQASQELARQTGAALLLCADEVFEAAGKERDGELKWAMFVEQMSKMRDKMREIAQGGVSSEHSKTRGVCKFIVEHEEAVWTFARVRGVEMTNNRAERALRPAVLWRLTSTGTRTDEGEKFVSSMLTVSETLKLQGRDVLSWLTSAIEAHRQGSAPPSLLPQTT
jgi:transposase